MEIIGRGVQLGKSLIFIRFVYNILFVVLFITIITIITPIFFQICGISHTRGKELSKYWPQGFYPEEDKDPDEWWR